MTIDLFDALCHLDLIDTALVCFIAIFAGIGMVFVATSDYSDDGE